MPKFKLILTCDEDQIDEFGDDVEADYATEAAEEWAEEQNMFGDFTEQTEVSVKFPSGKIKRFVVNAEPSVTYHASEIETKGGAE